MREAAMDKVTLLKQRLNEIAASLERHPQGLGLLGLGSAGKEQERLDEYSDLDFFAIVAKGHKQSFLHQLNWLTDVHEVAWYFQNTKDGYKLLYSDGVFCEFAIFETEELESIPYAQGQFIWRAPELAVNLATAKLPEPQPITDENFLLGELLTNLYVGLSRYHRGEKSSAFRFVQVHALDRLISLLDLRTPTRLNVFKDNFCIDRRVEQRHSQYETLLLQCMAGAHNTLKSARAMLDFVVQNYQVNQVLENEIRGLL